MKTKFIGDTLLAALVASIGIAIGFGVSMYYAYREKQTKDELVFQLEKEHWHCWIGRLYETGFECFVYKRKDADFGQFSGPRQRDNDIPKGKPVQQTQ